MALPERLVDLLAASTVEELTGGHQARVFQVIDHGGNRTIAKVLDAASVDRNDVATRVEVVAMLANLNDGCARQSECSGHVDVVRMGKSRVSPATSASGARCRCAAALA